MQNIIVFIIVLVALTFSIVSFVKRLRTIDKGERKCGDDCGGCSGKSCCK